MSYFYLAIAIVSEVIGTSALKAANGFSRPGPALLTAVGYAIAFYCMSLSLRTIPLELRMQFGQELGLFWFQWRVSSFTGRDWIFLPVLEFASFC